MVPCIASDHGRTCSRVRAIAVGSRHSSGHAHLRIPLQGLRPRVRDRAVLQGRSADRMSRVRRRARKGSAPPHRLQGLGLLRDRPRQEVEVGPTSEKKDSARRAPRARDRAAKGRARRRVQERKLAREEAAASGGLVGGDLRVAPGPGAGRHDRRPRSACSAARGSTRSSTTRETVDIDTPYGPPQRAAA